MLIFRVQSSEVERSVGCILIRLDLLRDKVSDIVFSSCLVIREEFFPVVGEIVLVEGERQGFQFDESLDTVFGSSNTVLEVVIDNGPDLRSTKSLRARD